MDAKNVLGETLRPCSIDPLTGFYRDGCCNSSEQDFGSHTICVRVTEAFLLYSSKEGNDLSTPRPEFEFPGLNPGDQWCVCAGRWKEAAEAGVAPPVVLAATHEKALEVVSIADLEYHALIESE
ncbi:MAG: hypothetical protein CMK54_04335 [Proteobacteria bacterium]|nr:hypothetical protein [Pseudomonadota bacterium]